MPTNLGTIDATVSLDTSRIPSALDKLTFQAKYFPMGSIRLSRKYWSNPWHMLSEIEDCFEELPVKIGKLTYTFRKFIGSKAYGKMVKEIHKELMDGSMDRLEHVLCFGSGCAK